VSSVELPWRRRLRLVPSVAMLVFSATLIAIAVRPGQFQAVHKAAMLTGAFLLAYSVAVQALNATRMQVRGGRLLVAHGPLPWRGRLDVALAEVRALACDRHSRRLVLRTALGEELVIAEDLPAGELATIDAQIRERLLPVPRATGSEGEARAEAG
jgi:hypothetical protein